MKKISIRDMQLLASRKSGTCLSAEYINGRTKLYWQCKNDHIWTASPENIKQGKWCPDCVGLRKKTIYEMKAIAKNKGGKCLSDSYVNCKTKLKWQCKEGHIWKSTPDEITNRGSWCGICSSYYSNENICRAVFERIFDKKFPKSKPSWLKNRAGNRLELDGYCKELKIAFEYHGKQHFERVNFFHRHRDIVHQMTDDEIKKKLCKRENIILIIIPYTIKKDAFSKYIIKECGKEKKVYFNINNINDVDIASLSINKTGKLLEMKSLAKNKGGKCLSQNYVDSKTKLQWKCKNGHIWKSLPLKVKHGQWCPYCAKNRRLTIEEMKDMARERGGKCLSSKYINATSKLKWQCKNGHKWEARPLKIRIGRWCPDCGGSKKLTIEDMRKIAQKRNGKCLSKDYINNVTKLTWQCKEGHVWKASPSSIKTGSWCRHCGIRKKWSIEEMQKMAQVRGGKCLSKEYKNIDSKLIWKCKAGHIWETTPYRMMNKRGNWCRICEKGFKSV